MEFFSRREAPGGWPGHTMADLMGVPKPEVPPWKCDWGHNATGWWRVEWHGANNVSTIPNEPDPMPGGMPYERNDWVVAFHGTKWEAVYPVLYHGRLRASQGPEQGDRVLGDNPANSGIYAHKLGTAHKCRDYSRFL